MKILAWKIPISLNCVPNLSSEYHGKLIKQETENITGLSVFILHKINVAVWAVQYRYWEVFGLALGMRMCGHTVLALNRIRLSVSYSQRNFYANHIVVIPFIIGKKSLIYINFFPFLIILPMGILDWSFYNIYSHSVSLYSKRYTVYSLTLSWIRGVRGHSPIFKQKHSILGLDFDFAYKELIWNKNYHFKSKNNQFMKIWSFEQKFY